MLLVRQKWYGFYKRRHFFNLWQRRVQVVGFQFSLWRLVGFAVSEKDNDDRNAVAMATLSLNHPGRCVQSCC